MGPFIKSSNKTSRMMFNLLIALTPIILFTVYKHGYIPYTHGQVDVFGIFYPLLFVLIGSLTTFIIELLYYLIIKRTDEFKTSYGFFPGLFLALILPIKTPIYVLLVGCLVASLSKIVFGGFGRNILNPALIGYIFVVATFSFVFSTSYYEVDTVSKATPLTNASMVSGIGTYDELVKPYGDLLDFFIGTTPGSLAETSTLLCLLAFIYLTCTKTIKWRISLSYISTVFLITFGISRLLGVGLYYPLFHILSGGLVFGAVFMATDPVTSAATTTGQIFQGILLGILTCILRFTTTEGVATSILIMNMFVFILDKMGSRVRFNSYACLPWVVLVCFMIIVSMFVLASKKRVVAEKDPNFNIVNKEVTDNKTIYTATQKGYGGNIKADVVIENGKIVSVEIISHNETKDRYQSVTDANYINKLIEGQDNLKNVDTVSGATVTSTSLRKLLINVMEDFH